MSLGSNNICSFQELRPLQNLKELVQLDLSDCPICELPDYRTTVFAMIPSLEILDNKNRKGEELVYSDDQGSYLMDSESNEDQDEGVPGENGQKGPK